jgi:hypothetical protein
MSKARDLADLGAVTDRLDTVGASDGALSNRNLIINGAMQVAQRGTSFTGLTNGGSDYTLDRWRWSEGGSPSFVTDVTQDTSAPDGFASSYKIAVTTAASSLGANHSLRLMTRLEGQDLQQTAFGTSSAKNLTLSFWVKSNKTGTYIAWFYNGDADRHISKAYTVDVADTWEYKTLTIDGDTVSGFTNDNGVSIQLEFVLAAGSDFTSGTLATTWQAQVTANRYVGNVNLADSTSNYWQITGVQLEIGDTATPFEHRSYGDELQRCQRYFEKQAGGASCEQGVVPFTPSYREHVQVWSVQKRAVPSVSFYTQGYYSYANNAVDTGTGTSVTQITVHSGLLITTGCTSRTSGDTVAVEHCVFEADAEL